MKLTNIVTHFPCFHDCGRIRVHEKPLAGHWCVDLSWWRCGQKAGQWSRGWGQNRLFCCLDGWEVEGGMANTMGKKKRMILLGGGNSNIFYFYHYLGKWSNLTNIFQMGWNHQLVYVFFEKMHGLFGKCKHDVSSSGGGVYLDGIKWWV